MWGAIMTAFARGRPSHEQIASDQSLERMVCVRTFLSSSRRSEAGMM